MAWMDDEIKRIKARDTQQEADKQFELHKAAVLRANASHLFSELRGSVMSRPVSGCSAVRRKLSN